MVNEETYVIKSNDAIDTERLGEKIGALLRGGEVLELVSDLGGGKTTFVRGLVRGTGSRDKVSSPTFTLSKVYRTVAIEIHHYDLYRISEAGLVAHELADSLQDPKIVTVVEWGGVARHVLPADRLVLLFKSNGENDREITLKFPPQFKYLLENL